MAPFPGIPRMLSGNGVNATRASSLLPGIPRILGSTSAAAVSLGVATLLALAVIGTSLVHLVEYHLGLGSANGRSAAATMLAQCPLRGDLLALLLLVVTLVLAVANSIRVLSRRKHRLEGLARQAGLATNALCVQMPRSGARYLRILVPLLILQVVVYQVFERAWPMGPMMRMNGVFIHMAPQGALPLAPVHLLIAVVLAAIVWRLERRISVLRALISVVRRLLARASTALRAPLPSVNVEINWRPVAGLLGLSRPPPGRMTLR
jgi:hypothetical protein